MVVLKNAGGYVQPVVTIGRPPFIAVVPTDTAVLFVRPSSEAYQRRKALQNSILFRFTSFLPDVTFLLQDLITIILIVCFRYFLKK